MLERLNQLLDADTRTRWRILGISASMIMACGLIGDTFTDGSLAGIQILATILGLMAFAAQVAIYCLAVSFRSFTLRDSHLRLSLGTVAATVILALVEETSLPRAQAAVLARRLRDALHLHASESQMAGVTQVLKDAAHARLSRRVVEKALNDANQKQPPEVVWKTLVAFLEYTVNTRTDTPRRPSGASAWSDAQPMTIDNDCGPENYSHGPVEQLSARHGEWLSSTDLAQWPDAIHDCRLVLDGAELTNVYVGDVLVTYRGGPLHLHNIRFGQCRFDLPSDKPNVRKFVDALLMADQNVVTINLP